MPVSRVCYASREDVQRAPDFKDSAGLTFRIDRAIQSVSEDIESRMHRVFYPADTTYKFDWPDRQGTAPWRLWLNQWDLLTLTQAESPHGTAIPLANVIPRPVNRKPGRPFRYVELDRSASSAFTAGATPQLSIWLTGTWGYANDTDPAGTLAAAIGTTSVTTVTVSDASKIGVGDLIIVDTERILVTDRAFADTTVSFGALAADDAVTVVAVADGTKFAVGEELRLDAERMLITDIAGNNLVVTRGFNGSVLAAHTSGTIFAARSLTVARGVYGSTAATHSNSAPVSRWRTPFLIRDLGIAEAINRVLQETGGYSRVTGEADMQAVAPGAGLPELWAQATRAHGRQARQRAV